jgi:hypothetical protein
MLTLEQDNQKNREGRVVPLARIAKMFNDGATVSEISDKLKFTDKKSDWPYSYTYGLLKKLRKGVKIGSKVVKLQRRQHSKKGDK